MLGPGTIRVIRAQLEASDLQDRLRSPARFRGPQLDPSPMSARWLRASQMVALRPRASHPHTRTGLRTPSPELACQKTSQQPPDMSPGGEKTGQLAQRARPRPRRFGRGQAAQRLGGATLCGVRNYRAGSSSSLNRPVRLSPGPVLQRRSLGPESNRQNLHPPDHRGIGRALREPHKIPVSAQCAATRADRREVLPHSPARGPLRAHHGCSQSPSWTYSDSASSSGAASSLTSSGSSSVSSVAEALAVVGRITT